MKTLALSVALVLTAVSTLCADPGTPVATVYKPVGSVDYQTAGKSWAKAAPAVTLLSGDKVRTGENSFVVIKFIENSIVRLQEKSEVTIRGNIAQNRQFSKNVYLDRGAFGFDVKKQRPDEKFEFSTPTSVASIRGTEGGVIAGANDVFFLSSGTIVVTNNFSKLSVTVNANQIATSSSDGSINVKDLTPDQLRQLLNETGGGGGGGEEGGTSSGGGLSLGFAVSSTPATEGQDCDVTVELTNTSIPFDTLKGIVSYFALAYKSGPMTSYKEVPATLSGSKVKFTVPAADVQTPSLNVYLIFRTSTGINLTYPPESAATNPIVIPVQSGSNNTVKIEFTDPSGQRKTLVIKY